MKFFVRIMLIVFLIIPVMTVAACGSSDRIPNDITDGISHEDNTTQVTDDGNDGDYDNNVEDGTPGTTGPSDGNSNIVEDCDDGDDEDIPAVTQPLPPPVTETAYTGKAAVSLVGLNVRAAPNTGANVVTTLSPGDTLPLVSRLSSGWYKVEYNGNTRYISANPTYSAVIDNTDYRVTADRVIAEGLKLLGKPYEFGAPRLFMWNGKLNTAFTGRTFDCSSFVQYIYYYGANVRLNADSRSQSAQGTQVSKANMRKGDLLFMYSTARQYNTGIERIGHVAMYIGNNQILHTFGTGGVRIQEYSAFWSERTLKVMRHF